MIKIHPHSCQFKGKSAAMPLKPEIYVYHHTHWDREWYQPFRQYQVRLAEVVDAILDRLDAGVFPCFTLDGQTVVLDDYLELRPWNRERLAQWIRSGRLNIGPWYVMPDEFLVSGESLIRNLKRGIETARAWGCHQMAGYLPDTFGHSGDIPTLLNQVGIHTAMVWRGVNPETSVFLWKSRNGRSVLTYYLANGYFQNMLHDPVMAPSERVRELMSLAEQLSERAGEEPVLLPLGGDHLGPVSVEGERVLRETLSAIHETTVPDFLNSLRERVNGNGGVPQLTGELRDHTGAFLLPGVFSSRMYLKQANRRLEHRLTRITEPLTAMAQLLPKNPGFYPSRELETAWTLLLQNHPHDSICGCSVDAVHRENEVRFDSVAAFCDALEPRQKAYLNAGTSDQWVLFNLGDRPYTGVVPVREWGDEGTDTLQQAQERQILVDGYLTDILDVPLAHRTMQERTGWIWAENIPPHGLRILEKSSGLADLPENIAVRATGQTLENGLIRLEILPDGVMKATDLTSGQTYPNLHQFMDYADQGDSYNSAPVPGESGSNATLVGCRIHTAGPLVGTIQVDYTFKDLDMAVETKVTLMAGSPRINFETRFTNLKPNHKLQVGFSTGGPIESVIAESHFGVEHRPYQPTYSEAAHMPAGPFKELMTNTGPIQRFVVANGQLVITEGLTEYEVRGEVLAITLLRAFGYLSKGDTGVRGAQAGPPFETPEGQCLGRKMVCRYAWMPAPETMADAYHEADCFYGVVFGEQGRNTPDVAFVGGQPEAQSLVRWNNPHIISMAMAWMPGEHNGLLVRLVNLTSEQQVAVFQTDFPFTPIREVNFLAESEGVVESSVIPFAPYSVKTLLFEVPARI